ncbi:MAG: hypothetical protein Q9187_000497 [Circinaria calcarea]
MAESTALFDAFRATGFCLLDLRGCSEGETFLNEAESVFRVNQDIHDLDLEEKMKYAFQLPKSLFGYKCAGATKIESGRPDRFEFYNTSQDDMLGNGPPRANPAPIENNRQLLKSYIVQAYSVVKVILSHLDSHLDLAPGTLASLQPQTKVSGTAVRLLRYMPQPAGDRRTSLLGHTDIGSVTLLFNVLGGLQILPAGLDNVDGNWRYVKPQPGCAILSLGDAMVEWTAGILRSNLHRVTYAPGEQANTPRYSVAYLVRPEASVSMKRLGVGGVIPALQEGEEDVDMDVTEWERQKATAIQSGMDNARSRGGREIGVQS